MCNLPYRPPFLKLSIWFCLKILGTGGLPEPPLDDEPELDPVLDDPPLEEPEPPEELLPDDEDPLLDELLPEELEPPDELLLDDEIVCPPLFAAAVNA